MALIGNFYNAFMNSFFANDELPSVLQWNLDLTKSLGTGQICSLNGGFVISRFHCTNNQKAFENDESVLCK